MNVHTLKYNDIRGGFLSYSGVFGGGGGAVLPVAIKGVLGYLHE